MGLCDFIGYAVCCRWQTEKCYFTVLCRNVACNPNTSAPEIAKIYFDVKNLFNFVTFHENPYFIILYLSASYLILFEIDILDGEKRPKTKNELHM